MDAVGITQWLRELQDSDLAVDGELHLDQQPLKVEDGRAYLCVVSLDALARFANNAGDRLFDANVRYYLRRTAVNKLIAATLKAEAQDFFFYNNGITIVCDDVRFRESRLVLSAAQVVNGCQTINEIRNAWLEKRKQREQIKGSVLVKVIGTRNKELKRNISQRTNSQNAVRTRDFLSMAREQKSLHQQFKNLGYFYEFRRGQGALLSAIERKRFQGLSQYKYLEQSNWRFRKISAFDAQQCFLCAYLDKPGEAKNKLGQYNPLDPEYQEVFEGLVSERATHYLIPSLVYEAAAKFNYGQSGYRWRAHARLFFVCATFRVIAEILRKLNWEGIPSDNRVRDPKVFGEVAQKLFADQEVGEAILQIADDALDSFDDALQEYENYDERNSYRKDDQRRSEKIDALLSRKIIRTLDKHERRRLLTAAHELLRSA